MVAHGIASSIDGEKVIIGSYHFVFEDEGCIIADDEQEKFDNLSDAYSHLYLAIGGRVKAVIMIDDPIKTEAGKVVKSLQSLGLKVVMLTGDSSRVAKRVAGELGVDEVKAQVLPEDKAKYNETFLPLYEKSMGEFGQLKGNIPCFFILTKLPNGSNIPNKR